MRILSISDYFGTGENTGGAGASALRIIKDLRQSGTKVEVIAGFQAPPSSDALEVNFLHGWDIREVASRSAARAVRAVWNPKAKRDLNQALQKYLVDENIIVVHQWTRYLSPSSLSLLAKYRTVVYVHDYFWMCPNGAYYNFQSGEPCTLIPMSMRCIAANCDRHSFGAKMLRVARQLCKDKLSGFEPDKTILIHISEVSKSIMEEYLPDFRHYVLPHSLDAALAGSEVPEGPVDYDVGYFGRIEPEKGVWLLSRAVEELGLKALFVGSGSAVSDLREKHPTARFVDWIEAGKVRPLMGRCRAIVLPSIWPETWGLVVPEALSAGVPAIVSCRAGSSDLIRRHGGGAIFDPGAPKSLTAALQKVLDEKNWPLLRGEAKKAINAADLSGASYARKFKGIIADAWNFEC